LSVVAILALALAPVLIRQLDQIAGDKEVSQLKAFAQAFRQGVLQSRSIPNTNGWYSMIATNLGLQTNQVLLNERLVARMFLIDPNLQIGSSVGLPYTQTTSGSQVTDGLGHTIAPIRPRLMILSSISQPLPTFTNNSNNFNNVWSAIDGTIPTALSSYRGKAEDLKIQRIHLGDVFVELIINNLEPQDTGCDANYAVDNVGGAVPPNTVFDAYFFDGTQLAFTNCDGNFQYSEVLHQSKSFDFLLRNWRGTEKFLGRTIQHPSPLDMQVAADAFRSSAVNPLANNGATPESAYQALLLYLEYFVFWRQTGYQPGTPTYSTLANAQTAFNNSQLLDDLINAH
jgi:type II secretory pathway pseudopilin PulG